ncbi:MAG TPA: LysM peptidoglycan-binding domain-containing protein [Thermodesulfovibrionales bacterium]|nr:LysM peptidoglycan-binding domain-containing protein [Thermodesulfovibrionales bacterium]
MRVIAFWIACVFILLLCGGGADAEQTYIVKKGDTLNKISRKFKVDVQKIREANDLDSSTLRPGSSLTIPSKGVNERKIKGKTLAQQPKKPHENQIAHNTIISTAETSPSPEGTHYHTVRKGETLASISRKYALSINDLKELNNIEKSARLKPGRKLIVKQAGPKTYTVRKGDTLVKISRKFNTSPDELMEINELDSYDLRPGQKLLLEVWVEPEDAKPAPSVVAENISDDLHAMTESPDLNSLNVKDRLVLFAKKMLNIPYRFGGSTFMGIDCSGYVQKVFGLLEVPLPRTAREQFHMGESVSKEELSMGDLVFFRTYASFPSHVGIYLGNNLFIHASSRNRKVSIDSLDAPYYFKRFIGAKRVFKDDVTETAVPADKG